MKVARLEQNGSPVGARGRPNGSVTKSLGGNQPSRTNVDLTGWQPRSVGTRVSGFRLVKLEPLGVGLQEESPRQPFLMPGLPLLS